MAAIFAGSSRVDAVFAPITTLPSCQVRVSRSPVAATRDLGSRGRFASRQTRVGALVSCGHGRLRRMVRRRPRARADRRGLVRRMRRRAGAGRPDGADRGRRCRGMGGVKIEESRPLGLRGGLRRVSRALIVYGIIGLVVTAIGFGALVWANGRVSHLRDETEATVARLASTMEVAAYVLHGASTTAQSFSATVDQSAQAVSAAAVTITEVRSDLSALEAQLRSVSILGATPLSSPADAVGRIAASMDGLDGRLSAIADSGEGNRDALEGNATALGELASSTQALAARLGSGVGQGSFGDIQLVIAVTLLAFAAWSLVPAVGALALGVWLRRELGPSRSG